MRELDTIDLQILKALQQNTRLTNAELAEQVGLSTTPCQRRVRMLEEDGFVRDYVALLDPAALGLDFSAWIMVRLERHKAEVVEAFVRSVTSCDEITECCLVTGKFDYMLRVYASDISTFRNFMLEKLVRLPGVVEASTNVILESTKSTTALPLPKKRFT
jgi:Lrp/AsnC family leucine-responsive transcriptional regulator